jgi:hypothetical protein
MGLVGRFLRENLWPIVTLITFGLGLWATLSITTLAQEQKNRDVQMAKTFSEEMRLAKIEGTFAYGQQFNASSKPPATPDFFQKLFPESLPPPRQDASLLYAKIDWQKVPEIWKWNEYLWKQALQKRDPAKDKQIINTLRSASDIMAIAEKASHLPQCYHYHLEESPHFLKPYVADRMAALFLARVNIYLTTNPQQALSDLQVAIRILRHHFHPTLHALGYNYHNEVTNSIFLLNKFSDFLYRENPKTFQQEKETLVRIVKEFSPNYLDFDTYMKIEKYKTFLDISKIKKQKYNTDFILDINPYFRFLDTINTDLENQISNKSIPADHLHFYRWWGRKRKEFPPNMTPQQELKVFNAAMRGMSRERRMKNTDAFLYGAEWNYTFWMLNTQDRLIKYRLMATRIALYAYKEKQGAFPTSLGALPPDTPTIDPMTGKSLVWWHDAKRGWLLYSLGPDGKDDTQNNKKPTWWPYDIVSVLGN